MKFIAGIFVLSLHVAYSAKIIIKSAPDPNAPLFEDTNFVFSKDIKDSKAPTVYNGDPMKAPIVNVFNERDRGKFHNAYGTGNGIEVESVGKIKETSTGKAFIVSGSYSYTGADGRRYRVRYTADEFGYHPMTELELDFPDPSENNRVSRTQEPEQKLERLNLRNQQDNGNDGGQGYKYDAPAEPSRLYLPAEAPSSDYLPPVLDVRSK